jgi:hypothetical protein
MAASSNLIDLAASKFLCMRNRRTVPICSCNLSCSTSRPGPREFICFPSFVSHSCPSRETTQCLSGRVTGILLANNIARRLMTDGQLTPTRGTQQTVSTLHNHDRSPILRYIVPQPKILTAISLNGLTLFRCHRRIRRRSLIVKRSSHR